jgi:hypothetical protein
MKQDNDRSQDQTKTIQIVSAEISAAFHPNASWLPENIIVNRCRPDKTCLYAMAGHSLGEPNHPGVSALHCVRQDRSPKACNRHGEMNAGGIAQAIG